MLTVVPSPAPLCLLILFCGNRVSVTCDSGHVSCSCAAQMVLDEMMSLLSAERAVGAFPGISCDRSPSMFQGVTCAAVGFVCSVLCPYCKALLVWEQVQLN